MKSFTDDSLMCGEEATLSRQRLSRENLLFTLFRASHLSSQGTLSIPKSGGIGLQVEVSNSFPPKISKKEKYIKSQKEDVKYAGKEVKRRRT